MIDVDRLARAIRGYVGPMPSPETKGAPTWYIDIDCMTSDADIRGLAEDLARQYDQVDVPTEPVPA